MLRFLGIVLLCIAASVAYGLVHDQITIRISPEYFTVLHPQILPDATPLTVLALAWGVIATWWVGLTLGLILAIASCAGSRPKLSARDLVQPVTVLLMSMAIGAAVAGVVGYLLGVYGLIVPAPFVAEHVPTANINRVFAAGGAHLASYLIGFVGGIGVAVRAWKRRGKLARATDQPANQR